MKAKLTNLSGSRNIKIMSQVTLIKNNQLNSFIHLKVFIDTHGYSANLK